MASLNHICRRNRNTHLIGLAVTAQFIVTNAQNAEKDREMKQQAIKIHKPKLLQNPNADNNRTIELNTTPNWFSESVFKWAKKRRTADTGSRQIRIWECPIHNTINYGEQ